MSEDRLYTLLVILFCAASFFPIFILLFPNLLSRIIVDEDWFSFLLHQKFLDDPQGRTAPRTHGLLQVASHPVITPDPLFI